MTGPGTVTSADTASSAAGSWSFGRPNPGKELYIDTPAGRFARLPVFSHLVTANDDIVAVVREHASPYLEPGDILAISEKIVAICEGRSYPLAGIRPSRLASWLSKFVQKTPHGIGIGSPWTMEFALREAGVPIGKGTGKRDQQLAQAAFQAWRAETGLPSAHLSVLAACSVGVVHGEGHETT